MLPTGAKKQVHFETNEDLVALGARELLAAGAVFEAEVLTTGQVSFEVLLGDPDGEGRTLASAICANGPDPGGVPDTFTKLVRDAHAEL